MHNEQHEVTIPAVLGANKLILRKNVTGGVHDGSIGLRISTPEYNVAIAIEPDQLMIAARTLCEPPGFNAKTLDLLYEVMEERERQSRLLAAGRIPYDCASPSVLCTAKLPVLMEEVGEVSVEINNILDPNLNDVVRAHARRDLRAELIQVAAVAVAWAESLTPEVRP